MVENWFLSVIQVTSAVLMLAAAYLFHRYNQDFFLDTPRHWNVISTGMVLTALASGVWAVATGPTVKTAGAVITVLAGLFVLAGFWKAYEDSAGGFL
jgi:dolichyl-phosphate-mannose--protein O-mannosyl transferase